MIKTKIPEYTLIQYLRDDNRIPIGVIVAIKQDNKR